MGLLLLGILVVELEEVEGLEAVVAMELAQQVTMEVEEVAMEPMEEMDIIALEVVEDMVKEDMVVLTALPFGFMPLEGAVHMEEEVVLEKKAHYLAVEEAPVKMVRMVFV